MLQGTITKDLSFTATSATLIDTEPTTYTVNITQSANQTITVVCGGTTYTSTFKAEKGSVYTVSITADKGYTAGTLSTTGGTLNSDVYIMASEATKSAESKYLKGWCALPLYDSYSPTLYIDEGTEDNTMMLDTYSESYAYTVGTVTKQANLITYPDTRCFGSPTPEVQGNTYTWDNLPYGDNISMLEGGVNYFVPPVWHGIVIDSKFVNATMADIPICELSEYATISDLGTDDSNTTLTRYGKIMDASSEDFGKEIYYPLEKIIYVTLTETIFNIQVDTPTVTITCYANTADDLPQHVNVCVGDLTTGEYSFLHSNTINWGTDGTGTFEVSQGNNDNTFRTTIMNAFQNNKGKYFVGFMFPDWYPMTYDDIEG